MIPIGFPALLKVRKQEDPRPSAANDSTRQTGNESGVPPSPTRMGASLSQDKENSTALDSCCSVSPSGTILAVVTDSRLVLLSADQKMSKLGELSLQNLALCTLQPIWRPSSREIGFLSNDHVVWAALVKSATTGLYTVQLVDETQIPLQEHSSLVCGCSTPHGLVAVDSCSNLHVVSWSHSHLGILRPPQAPMAHPHASKQSSLVKVVTSPQISPDISPDVGSQAVGSMSRQHRSLSRIAASSETQRQQQKGSSLQIMPSASISGNGVPIAQVGKRHHLYVRTNGSQDSNNSKVSTTTTSSNKFDDKIEEQMHEGDTSNDGPLDLKEKADPPAISVGAFQMTTSAFFPQPSISTTVGNAQLNQSVAQGTPDSVSPISVSAPSVQDAAIASHPSGEKNRDISVEESTLSVEKQVSEVSVMAPHPSGETCMGEFAGEAQHSVASQHPGNVSWVGFCKASNSLCLLLRGLGLYIVPSWDGCKTTLANGFWVMGSSDAVIADVSEWSHWIVWIDTKGNVSKATVTASASKMSESLKGNLRPGSVPKQLGGPSSKPTRWLACGAHSVYRAERDCDGEPSQAVNIKVDRRGGGVLIGFEKGGAVASERGGLSMIGQHSSILTPILGVNHPLCCNTWLSCEFGKGHHLFILNSFSPDIYLLACWQTARSGTPTNSSSRGVWDTNSATPMVHGEVVKIPNSVSVGIRDDYLASSIDHPHGLDSSKVTVASCSPDCNYLAIASKECLQVHDLRSQKCVDVDVSVGFEVKGVLWWDRVLIAIGTNKSGTHEMLFWALPSGLMLDARLLKHISVTAALPVCCCIEGSTAWLVDHENNIVAMSLRAKQPTSLADMPDISVRITSIGLLNSPFLVKSVQAATCQIPLSQSATQGSTTNGQEQYPLLDHTHSNSTGGFSTILVFLLYNGDVVTVCTSSRRVLPVLKGCTDILLAGHGPWRVLGTCFYAVHDHSVTVFRMEADGTVHQISHAVQLDRDEIITGVSQSDGSLLVACATEDDSETQGIAATIRRTQLLSSVIVHLCLYDTESANHLVKSCSELPDWIGIIESAMIQAASVDPNHASLDSLLAVLEPYPDRLDAMVHVVRKAQQLDNLKLLDAIGSPPDVFQRCLLAGRLALASSLVLVIQNHSGFGPSWQAALRLLQSAVEESQPVIAIQTFAFVKRMSIVALEEHVDGSCDQSLTDAMESCSLAWLYFAMVVALNALRRPALQALKKAARGTSLQVPALDLAVHLAIENRLSFFGGGRVLILQPSAGGNTIEQVHLSCLSDLDRQLILRIAESWDKETDLDFDADDCNSSSPSAGPHDAHALLHILLQEGGNAWVGACVLAAALQCDPVIDLLATKPGLSGLAGLASKRRIRGTSGKIST